MAPSAIDRARHIKDSIDTLRREVGDASLDEVIARPLDWAGFKYLLLIVSEAARQLPAEWQTTFGPEIDWRRVADLANTLRHAYHSAHTTTLWNIYLNDLDPLEAAIDAMLAAHTPTPPPPANS